MNDSTQQRILLFDFDGTLADTFPRVWRLLPRLAAELRFRAPSTEEIGFLRQCRLPEILSSLRIAWWKVPLVAWRARALLAADREPVPFFPGIVELLRELDGAGIEWGILTSNGQELVRRALGQAGVPEPGWLDCGAGLSAKAGRLRRFARGRGVGPGRMLLVGDETRDLEAAVQVGAGFVGVGWGYNSAEALLGAGAERVARDAAQLREVLGLAATSSRPPRPLPGTSPDPCRSP